MTDGPQQPQEGATQGGTPRDGEQDGEQDGEHEAEAELTELRPRLSPRERARRLVVVVGVVVLGLALLLGGVPSLRDGVRLLLVGPSPTPTPAPIAGVSNFYFLATPAWVDLLVDGRRVARIPVAGDGTQPLQLAPGRHTLEWQGAPFQILSCSLVVPVPFIITPQTSFCALRQYLGVPAGYVVQQRESLATLPGGQQSALLQAIDAGLNDSSAKAVIQPGESYLALANDRPRARVTTASVALSAALRYTRVTGAPQSDPCAQYQAIQPCRFPDQDCRNLCTATPNDSSVPADTNTFGWIVAVPAHAAWELDASNGSAVGQGLVGPGEGIVNPGAEDLLVLLRIMWDGTAWQVTPLFGHTHGPVADDSVCSPARDWLADAGEVPAPILVPIGSALWGQSDGQGGGVVYASGPNPTDGCFVSVASSALAVIPNPPISGPTTFLLRFGVLVAVNASARQIAPTLPVADASEQAIAGRLQAQLGALTAVYGPAYRI